jgi:UDP-N-acetyl-D-mannosaminuronic acid transferase (WecB/TagA/CpsF family)
MLDFQSLCSTSSAYKHAEGYFGGDAEVWQEQAKRSYQAAVQNLNFIGAEDGKGN